MPRSSGSGKADATRGLLKKFKEAQETGALESSETNVNEALRKADATSGLLKKFREAQEAGALESSETSVNEALQKQKNLDFIKKFIERQQKGELDKFKSFNEKEKSWLSGIGKTLLKGVADIGDATAKKIINTIDSLADKAAGRGERIGQATRTEDVKAGTEETTDLVPAGAEGKHVITAPEFIAKWTSVKKGAEMPVCRLMARRSTAEKLSSSEIQKNSQTGTTRNVSFDKDKTFQTNQFKDVFGNISYTTNTKTTTQKSAEDFVNVVYDNFLIDKVQLTKRDKTQIVQTFDDSFLYSFGQAPEQAQFSGVLINTKNHNWRTGWVKHYDQLLSAHNSLKNYVNTFLTYENMVWKGRVLNTNIVEQASNPVAVRFNFNFYIEEDLTPLGEKAYDAPGDEPPFPYTKPLRNLKQGEIPADEQFQQSTASIPPKKPNAPNKEQSNDVKEDTKECGERVQDNLKDGQECKEMVNGITEALSIPKCESWKDENSEQLQDEIAKWIKQPIINARSEINKLINGDVSVNKNGVISKFKNEFETYFSIRESSLEKLVNALEKGTGLTTNQEIVEQELNSLFPDAAVIRFNDTKEKTSKVISGTDIYDQFYQGFFDTNEEPVVDKSFFESFSGSQYNVPDQYVNNIFENDYQQKNSQSTISFLAMLGHIINNDIGERDVKTALSSGFVSSGGEVPKYKNFVEKLRNGVKKWLTKIVGWNNLMGMNSGFPEKHPERMFKRTNVLVNSLLKEQDTSGEIIWPEQADVTKTSFINDLKLFRDLFKKYKNKEKIKQNYRSKAPKQIKKRLEYFNTSANPNGNSYYLTMLESLQNNMTDKVTASFEGDSSVLGFIVYYSFMTNNPELGSHNKLSKKENEFMLPGKAFLRTGRGAGNQHFSFLTPLGKIKRTSGAGSGNPENVDPIDLPSQDKLYRGSPNTSEWPFKAHFNLGKPDYPNTLEPYGAGTVQIAYAQANDEIEPDDIDEPESDFWNPNVGDTFQGYRRAKRKQAPAYAFVPMQTATETYQSVVDKLIKARNRYKKVKKCLNKGPKNGGLKESWVPTVSGRIDPDIIKRELTAR